MFELRVSTDFSAAHSIRGHMGRCAKLHGHNWKVEALLRSGKLDKLGMVRDAGEVKDIVRGFVNKNLDHVFLNQINFFRKNNPSSENIAKFIFSGLKKILPNLAEVCVSESESVRVAYSKK